MVHRTLAHVTSMPLFLHKVSVGHNVAPDVMVSADGGQGKVIVTATVFYRGENGIEDAEMYLLAMIDEIPESRKNLNIMLKALGFPLKDKGKFIF